MGEDGKPVYDQTFFLALARRGKDAWNEWRDGHPDIKVTFEGVHFEEPDNMGIDFRISNSAAARILVDADFSSVVIWTRTTPVPTPAELDS
jgi:hypothetical protein